MRKVFSLKYILILLVLSLSIKLIWFEPEFNKEYAYSIARSKLKNMSERYLFKLDGFGDPTEITGTDELGYTFRWELPSVTTHGAKLSISIGVSKYSDNFSGTPYLPDCRKGYDGHMKQSYPYLCFK
jgi:hypothetical protein